MKEEERSGPDAGFTLTDPDAIQMMRMLAIRSGIALEMRGLKRNGRSCTAIARAELGGMKGFRPKILAAWDEKIRAYADEKGFEQPLLKEVVL